MRRADSATALLVLREVEGIGMKPGTRAVLDLLRRSPNGVTPLDALDEVGSFRLGARIWELREAGYAVDTEWLRTAAGKRIARYRLQEAPVQLSLGVA